MGVIQGTSAGVKASQHDSTVHVSRNFLPKRKDRQSLHHYYDVTTVLIM